MRYREPQVALQQTWHEPDLLFLELGQRFANSGVPGVLTSVQKDQALYKQSTAEGCIPQLQFGEFAAGQILDNHALSAICI